MNNSKLALDNFNIDQEVDRTPWFKDREGTLVRQIEALRKVTASKEWSSLKKELFDGVVETLEKNLKSEAQMTPADPVKLAQISGQLIWARKWSDLTKVADILMVELTNIRQQLTKYGQKTEI